MEEVHRQTFLLPSYNSKLKHGEFVTRKMCYMNKDNNIDYLVYSIDIIQPSMVKKQGCEKDKNETFG